ncbi:MAG TPA: nuclear transport factor 2 family protein [Candidatus Sulfotelmatobacter sp.]|nr:nuclear transport factor 2 family protein [Candidatus Sulfotelmatobacter sp.]
MQDRAATSADIEVLREAYEAFNAADFERVLTLMDPGVDWPNGWEGGRVLGREAVRSYWARQFAELQSRVEPLDFRQESDGCIAVRVHQVAHDKSGKLLADQVIEHVYRLQNGLITRMDIRN